MALYSIAAMENEKDLFLKKRVSGAGSHILKWRYVKDSSSLDGSDCVWA